MPAAAAGRSVAGSAAQKGLDGVGPHLVNRTERSETGRARDDDGGSAKARVVSANRLAVRIVEGRGADVVDRATVTITDTSLYGIEIVSRDKFGLGQEAPPGRPGTTSYGQFQSMKDREDNSRRDHSVGPY
ncbi:uncharacterized protein FRV6_16610 [Fusarium oxysporum]|uniref:Uncharacterized protein n=1 Tax=Fusarium oxysporum TaxID=5507 RepID=A0A2H3TV44_FUSOX|nr:uncharacterized protein FRV6_16610 [Fusarium oxysporum]